MTGNIVAKSIYNNIQAIDEKDGNYLIQIGLILRHKDDICIKPHYKSVNCHAPSWMHCNLHRPCATKNKYHP